MKPCPICKAEMEKRNSFMAEGKFLFCPKCKVQYYTRIGTLLKVYYYDDTLFFQKDFERRCKLKAFW